MSVIAAALKHMLAAGMAHDAIVEAVAAMEAVAAPVVEPDTRTARQARNARYYAASKERLKASENRLNASEASYSDAEQIPPKTKISPRPPIKTQPPKGGNISTREREEPADFDRFWAVYPRKVGKEDARRKFAAAVKAGARVAELIVAVERDRTGQWAGRPPDMIPHPSTWLHQGRWQDEPPPQPTNDHTPPRGLHDRRSRQSQQLDERFENYSRAFSGAEIAAQRRALEPSGGF